MKMRMGTFPREVEIFDVDKEKVGTKIEEGHLLAFELTAKEYKTLFGGVDPKDLSPKAVLAKLSEAKEV